MFERNPHSKADMRTDFMVGLFNLELLWGSISLVACLFPANLAGHPETDTPYSYSLKTQTQDQLSFESQVWGQMAAGSRPPRGCTRESSTPPPPPTPSPMTLTPNPKKRSNGKRAILGHGVH